MKKRIGWQSGILYNGWVSQFEKLYGWSTVIEFDPKR